MTYNTVTLTSEEFGALSARHPQGNFQQTNEMLQVAKSRIESYDLVGVRSGDDLVAGCSVVYTRGRFGVEGSVWLGPLCDAHDASLLAAMTEGIRAAARQRGAVSVTCWPNLVYQRHDSQGEPEGQPDTEALQAYESLG